MTALLGLEDVLHLQRKRKEQLIEKYALLTCIFVYLEISVNDWSLAMVQPGDRCTDITKDVHHFALRETDR